VVSRLRRCDGPSSSTNPIEAYYGNTVPWQWVVDYRLVPPDGVAVAVESLVGFVSTEGGHLLPAFFCAPGRAHFLGDRRSLVDHRFPESLRQTHPCRRDGRGSETYPKEMRCLPPRNRRGLPDTCILSLRSDRDSFPCWPTPTHSCSPFISTTGRTSSRTGTSISKP